MEWMGEDGGHTYATSMWPLVLIGLGAVLVLPAGVWLFVVTRGWHRGWSVGRVLGAVSFVLLPFVLGIVMCVVYLAALDSSLALTGDLECTRAQVVPTWSVFGRLIVIESFLSLLTVLLTGIITAVYLGRHAPEGQAGRARPARVVVGLCSLVAALGLGHAAWLITYGGLPRLEQDAPAYFHQGREAALALRPRTCSVPDGWSYPDPVPIPTGERGRLARTAVASSRWITARRTITASVGREVGSRVLPLRVGNRWTYDVERTSSGRAIFGVLPLRRGAAQSTVTILVAGAAERGGLRVFTVSIGDGQRVEERRLFAFEGRVLMEVGDRAWFALRTRTAAARYDQPVTSPDHAGRYTNLLLGATCQGFDAGQDGLIGPSECSRGSSERSFRLGFYTTLFSAGLLTITGGGSMHARLVSSSWGPADAPATPP